MRPGRSKKANAAQLNTFVNTAPVLWPEQPPRVRGPSSQVGTLLTTPEVGAIELER